MVVIDALRGEIAIAPAPAKDRVFAREREIA